MLCKGIPMIDVILSNVWRRSVNMVTLSLVSIVNSTSIVVDREHLHSNENFLCSFFFGNIYVHESAIIVVHTIEIGEFFS